MARLWIPQCFRVSVGDYFLSIISIVLIWKKNSDSMNILCFVVKIELGYEIINAVIILNVATIDIDSNILTVARLSQFPSDH